MSTISEIRLLFEGALLITKDDEVDMVIPEYVVGNLKNIKVLGNLIIARLIDDYTSIQVSISKDTYKGTHETFAVPFEEIKEITENSLVTVTGEVYQTRTNEVTIRVFDLHRTIGV